MSVKWALKRYARMLLEGGLESHANRITKILNTQKALLVGEAQKLFDAI